MKVLHICQRDDPATGGAARVAVELTKRLPDHGIESVCCFVYGDRGPFSEEIPASCRHLGIGSSREFVGGISRLKHLVAAESADIIHHHDGLIWTHLATRSIQGVAKVGHGHLSPPPVPGTWRNRLAHRIQAGTYSHLFAVSESTRLDWVARGFEEGECSVLANGVDLERFRPPLSGERQSVREAWKIGEDARVVGFVGRIDSEMKGCREFVELLAALGETFFGVMAGDGPDRQTVEAYAQRLGVANRLAFPGVVDPAREVYPGLDVFVMTSRYEPFGLVLLEAAASGLPIAMLPGAGGAVDLGRELGALILPDRAMPPFAAAVRSLALEAPRERIRTCDEVLARFSWDHVAANLATAYANLLHSVLSVPHSA